MQHSLSLSRPLSMSRAIPLLVVVLAVQLALAALLALRTDPLAGSAPQAPLIGAAAESADRLVIDATAAASDNTGVGSRSIVLAKRSGKWVLPQSFDAPARGTQVSSLLALLADLKRGLPVATSAAALKRFKLVDANFDRRLQLSQGGKALGTLYLGSSSGVHKSFARTSNERAVFNVDLANYQVPMQPSDWLDTGIVSHDLGSLSEIDLTTDPHRSLQLHHEPATAGSSALHAAAATPSGAPGAGAASAAAPSKSASTWTAAGAEAGQQIDSARADTLARDISLLQVQGVLGLQPKAEWQLDHPSLVLMLTTSQASGANVTWTLAKPSSGDYYVMKSSQFPWYFQVESGTAKQLIDASETTALFKSASAGTPRSSVRSGAAGQKVSGRP